MNISIVVILVLTVVALSNLCSGAYIYERRLSNSRSKQCDFQQAADTNNCVRGWYKNICKNKVCFKDVGDNCGSPENLDHQLKFGKCGRGLICCGGTCTDSQCNLSLDDPTGNIHIFMQNEKRKSDMVLAKIPSEQLDDEEY